MINEKLHLEKGYRKFLHDFNIVMSEEEIKKRLSIMDDSKTKYEKTYNMDETRENLIKRYIEVCNDFNISVSKDISQLPNYIILDYIMKNIDIEIGKRFGNKLSEVDNIIERKRVKDAITALFDQRIYININQVNELINVKKDKEKIIEKYLSFGGLDSMLSLSDIELEDEYEDEYEYNEEEV